MSQITKKELQRAIQRQESRIDGLVGLLAKKGYYDKEPKPQLKQLDQSVFNGLDEKWRWFGVNSDGSTIRATDKPKINVSNNGFILLIGDSEFSDDNYDASNWQNSLIERDDIAKELTGSELCRAMLARGDKYISGFGHHYSDALALQSKFADTVSKHTQCFQSSQNAWDYFVPINNQGEPLTQAEVGL